MVTQYGMSSELGTQIFGQPNHEVFLGRDYGNTQDYSEETARRIDDEVARIMKQAHDTAYEILSAHKDQMDLMASVLLERETVDGDACQALLDNTWAEYLAHEQSEEGRAQREAAATTVAHDVMTEATTTAAAPAPAVTPASAAPAAPTASTVSMSAPATGNAANENGAAAAPTSANGSGAVNPSAALDTNAAAVVDSSSIHSTDEANPSHNTNSSGEDAEDSR